MKRGRRWWRLLWSGCRLGLLLHFDVRNTEPLLPFFRYDGMFGIRPSCSIVIVVLDWKGPHLGPTGGATFGVSCQIATAPIPAVAVWAGVRARGSVHHAVELQPVQPWETHAAFIANMRSLRRVGKKVALEVVMPTEFGAAVRAFMLLVRNWPGIDVL